MGVSKMKADLKELFRQAEKMHPKMMKEWQFLVDRDCGPDCKEGVDRTVRDTADFLEAIGFSVRFHVYENAGNMLVAEYGDMHSPFVVLTGHLDTVFARGTVAGRPFAEENGRVTGPGVLDMKGGITILLYVCKILAENGYNRYPLKIILAGDEETGHARSGAAGDYLKEARGALMGFNLETGFTDNRVIVERKGVFQCRFDTEGIGAHAGNNPEDGRSAVRELSRKVWDIEELTDRTKGTNVNVGVFSGGTVANAVPEKASCVVDVRFRTNAELERVQKGLEKIAASSYVEGTKTTYTPIVRVAAMEKLPGTDELFSRAEKAAEESGLPPMKADSVGGGSDSAYLTAAGVPTLCALGVKGQYNHTVREWAEESSLTERTKLMLALLMKL